MPIYEYRCSNCGHQQEFMQKLSDAPLTTCTKCNKPTFTKMLTAAGFQLKGSGWYATDFKSKGSGARREGQRQGRRRREEERHRRRREGLGLRRRRVPGVHLTRAACSGDRE